MTLVYRTPKEQLIKPANQLGPGSYNVDLKSNLKNQKHTKSCVFASSSCRDPFEIKKHEREEEEAFQKCKGKKKQSLQQDSTCTQLQNVSSLVRPKKYIDCSHVFNSKVGRFQTRNQKSQQKFNQVHLVQEFKKLLLNDMTTTPKGKLLKVKDKLQKQKEIDDNYQVFPSIPNHSSSHGYRYDSETNKWVSNQNPKLMELIMQRERVNHKANHALGPGCYVYNPNKKSLEEKKLKENEHTRKSSDFVDSFTYPSLKPETPIYHSIEEEQNKKKLKTRLLGQSPIHKTQQIISKVQNPLLFNDPNLQGKDKKEVLLLNQMYKKFKQYIPKEEQLSPSNYLQKIKQRKNDENQSTETLKLKDVSNGHQYFLSRSQRFDLEAKHFQKQKQQISQANQKSFDQTINSSILDNSALILKSHNCKEPYSLGEDRFKQVRAKQNLGPGTYNCQKLPNTKLPPCLNLKDQRFDRKTNSNNFPGPGQYNVSQKMLKKQNRLSDAYAYYKKFKNEEILKHFTREDSMESLYQTWGRQMNYMVKLEHQPRPQDKQEEEKVQKPNENEEKSLIKTKQQLEASLKQFSNTSQNVQKKARYTFKNERIASTVELRSISQKNESKSPSKIYPKITKHLYEYKELPPNNKQQLMGPGIYQTRRDMVKKTFNVTYT